MRRSQRNKQRIVILCEGDTEENAVKHFIQRQWEIDGLTEVGLPPRNLYGKLEDVTKFAHLYLSEPGIIAVFTLVDLYGMNRVQHNANDDLDTKVNRVKQWLEKDLPPEISQRFHSHVSVHEVEAWLLADGHCLANRLNEKNIKPNPNAETQNFEKPPSRRLKELFKRHKGRGYNKLNDGIPLFKDAKFDIVYKSCSYFKAFYDDLKKTAQAHLSN